MGYADKLLMSIKIGTTFDVYLYPPFMKRSACLFALASLLMLASCARKNNCPAYGNTRVESAKR